MLGSEDGFWEKMSFAGGSDGGGVAFGVGAALSDSFASSSSSSALAENREPAFDVDAAP